MYQLRQYQAEAVSAALDFLADGRKRNGLIVLPTGAGKSLVWAKIGEALDAPFLLFQPSREILEQNLSKFQSFGIRPAVYSASVGRKSIGQVTLATIGSVKDKAHLFEDFGYIGVDECDLTNAKGGMYKKFFDALDGVKLIGATATPYRLSTDSYGSILKFLTRTRPRIWHEVIYYAQLSDLFNEGYLCKLEYHKVKGFNRWKVRTNSSGADFDDRSIQRHFDEINFKALLVKCVNRLLERGRKNVLVFTRFLEESHFIAQNVPEAVVVSADTPKAERNAIGKEFRAGNIKVVCNVGIYSVGFDYPELETVVLGRPTMSLRLAYQQMGRGVRPHPNKESCWIIDMVGITEMFGKLEDLTLHENEGKWFYATGDRPLTNIYFGDSGRMRCAKCGASYLCWARHVTTNNAAPIARPKEGILPNINLIPKDGKTYYTVVPPGTGEFVTHWAQCANR